jgi:hypothetical protein
MVVGKNRLINTIRIRVSEIVTLVGGTYETLCDIVYYPDSCLHSNSNLFNKQG